ncbi:hypothetical protein AVEN_201327-1 [Araneus ventricosus]|uniref:Uncharacterized protein n=1 Tax=Araneus ventricosus TaxID=182803 RepID=A0A4Y2V3D9_ARAVE|nr:hypothetical protein AVEN_201327-1 [Araneus ventricosus]
MSYGTALQDFKIIWEEWGGEQGSETDSRKPIKSPHLIQDFIHETLQEISQQTGLECFRSNKRRNESTEKKVWLGGSDKTVLVRNLKLPNANTFAEEGKLSKETAWVWELYAYNPYRRPTFNKAKSPFFYEYGFHHDGIVMGKFAAEDHAPEIIRKHTEFENSESNFDIKIHPYINNQYIWSMFNESDNSPTPPILWKSNQFTLTTDDAGIGILCLKQFLSIGVRFFSKRTGEDFENFGFQLFFRLRKIQAENLMQRLMDREIGRPVPVLTHLGETGDALSNEANYFWDNAVGGTSQGDQASASLAYLSIPNQSLLQTPPAIEKTQNQKRTDDSENIKKTSTDNAMEDDVPELEDG